MRNEREIGVREALCDLEASQGIGVAVVVVDRDSLTGDDPSFWTVHELISKPQTARIAGQISVPAETKKRGESALDNLFGGIAEFTDSDEVLARLRFLPGEFYSKSAISVNGMSADVAVLVYDGSVEIELKPCDEREVEPAGWMKVSEAKKLNGEMRSIARDSLLFASSSGLMQRIADNSEGLVSVLELMSDDFSLTDFIEKRNSVKDIQLN